MELETMYIFIAFSSIIGFFVGNLVSPSTRWAKKEIQYWRGLTGDFKKQLKAEKRASGSDNDLDSLLDGDLNLSNSVKFAQKSPAIVEQVKSAIGGLGAKPEIDDKSAFTDGRLR